MKTLFIVQYGQTKNNITLNITKYFTTIDNAQKFAIKLYTSGIGGCAVSTGQVADDVLVDNFDV